MGIFNEYGNIEEFIETSTQLAFNDLHKTDGYTSWKEG